MDAETSSFESSFPETLPPGSIPHFLTVRSAEMLHLGLKLDLDPGQFTHQSKWTDPGRQRSPINTTCPPGCFTSSISIEFSLFSLSLINHYSSEDYVHINTFEEKKKKEWRRVRRKGEGGGSTSSLYLVLFLGQGFQKHWLRSWHHVWKKWPQENVAKLQHTRDGRNLTLCDHHP